MKRTQFSWREAIYYGEVFGFVLAWIVGLIVLANNDSTRRDASSADDLASVSERAVPSDFAPVIKVD